MCTPADCDMDRAAEWVTALLTQRTSVTFSAHGPSMNPLIPDGARVRVRPAAGASLCPGHVLLFKQHGRLILHRGIRRLERGARWVVAADAALAGRHVIPRGDILGIAECVSARGQTRRIDHRYARGLGLIRYALRPLRRLADAVCR